MKYTTLGDTGVRVSRICLGCMSYGSRQWRPWILEEDDAMPFFRRAVEAGINFFDTADVYSVGRSEEVTGKALREYANLEEVVLATKVHGVMGKGANLRGLSRKHIVQGCEASLKRLGVETIDLYQIHRFDPFAPMEETLAAMDLLVRQGKVRYIGASSGPAWKMAQALALSDAHDWPRFATMQNHYNLVYREEEREMNPLCEAEGVGLIPWSPLARGLLTGSRTSLDDQKATTRAVSDEFAQHLYDHPGDWKVVETLLEVASEQGHDPAQVALAWLLAQPNVVAPIIGATKMDHLDSAIGAVEIEIDDETIVRLEAAYEPHAVRGHCCLRNRRRTPAAIFSL